MNVFLCNGTAPAVIVGGGQNQLKVQSQQERLYAMRSPTTNHSDHKWKPYQIRELPHFSITTEGKIRLKKKKKRGGLYSGGGGLVKRNPPPTYGVVY